MRILFAIPILYEGFADVTSDLERARSSPAPARS